MMKLILVLLLAAHGDAYECGNKLIGVDPRADYWPWQVSLKYLSWGGYTHICGGTLIDPYWVLTAASCIRSRTDTTQYRVILGEYDLNRREPYEQTMMVERIFPSSWGHDCLECPNDLALMKLSRPAVLNAKVLPACLPESSEGMPFGALCYISGWEELNNGPLVSKLQLSQLAVVDPRTCDFNPRRDIICAGIDNSAVCNGDNGGPLICRAGLGGWYVLGVAGYLTYKGCLLRLEHTVFTRTSSFTPWIRDTMERYWRH